MKKVALFIVIALILTPSVIAQSADASVWTKFSPDGEVKFIPWIVGDVGGVSFDARYDFDWPGAPSLLVGKKFKLGNTNVTPTLGYIGGEYGGYTAQVTTWWQGKKISIFTLNQGARGGKESPNFGLHVLQFRYALNDILSVGIDEEAYVEQFAKPDLQAGPAVNVAWGDTGFYTTVWYAVHLKDGVHTKTFVGIGRSF